MATQARTMPLEELVPTPERFDNADRLLTRLREDPLSSGNWIFRGQRKSTWSLLSTLERFEHEIGAVPTGRTEKASLTDFQRHAHHFHQNLPATDDVLEWLSLMRHHGSPTRLVDFTRSPYVAAFFATAEADPNEGGAIWAIDSKALEHYAAIVISHETMSVRFGDFARRYLAPQPVNRPRLSFSDPEFIKAIDPNTTYGPYPAAVVPVEPIRMNERMRRQQGLFLLKTSPFASFENSLKAVMKQAKEAQVTAPIVHKLIIQPTAYLDVLHELVRMNINYDTLLPGLDGLALSFQMRMRLEYGQYWRARNQPSIAQPGSPSASEQQSCD
jgi:hypothetical protein